MPWPARSSQRPGEPRAGKQTQTDDDDAAADIENRNDDAASPLALHEMTHARHVDDVTIDRGRSDATKSKKGDLQQSETTDVAVSSAPLEPSTLRQRTIDGGCASAEAAAIRNLLMRKEMRRGEDALQQNLANALQSHQSLSGIAGEVGAHSKLATGSLADVHDSAAEPRQTSACNDFNASDLVWGQTVCDDAPTGKQQLPGPALAPCPSYSLSHVLLPLSHT